MRERPDVESWEAYLAAQCHGHFQRRASQSQSDSALQATKAVGPHLCSWRSASSLHWASSSW